MGATTIWERWDSMLPDGSVNPGEMTSFNHYALGAVADWLHRTVAGLAPGEPGYRRLEFQPRPGGGLSHAAARHSTPYGTAACSWRLTAEDITVEVEVPPNTTARVTLPGKDGAPIEIASGKHTWTYAYQASDKKRKQLSVDSTIGELIDDAEAFSLVVQAMPKHGPDLLGNLLTLEETSLRDALGFLPWGEELLARIAKALSELNS
jgi:alpha-L-rhamnosidase